MAALLADGSKSTLFENPATSEPERTRSLPNRHLNLSHENFAVKASGDFGRGGRFEEQRERLNEADPRFFNRHTLAPNIEFRAQRHKTVVLVG